MSKSIGGHKASIDLGEALEDKRTKDQARESAQFAPSDVSEFDRDMVAVGAAPIDGWFRPGLETAVYGILLGRFRRKGRYDYDGSPYFYQVRLEKYACQASRKGGEVVTLVPGEVIAIGESAAMVELATYSEHPNRYRVLIKPLGKSQLSGGRTFHRLEIRAKDLQPGVALAASKRPTYDVDVEEDQLPY